MPTLDLHTITTPPALDRGRLRQAVEDAFTELALHPEREFHFISGRRLAERLGYPGAWLDTVPERAVASFSGVGNPFRLGPIHEGERVLDLGCGSGTDALLAARRVGAEGAVIAVDMTAAMVERARESVLAARATQVRVEWGYAESIPVSDGSIDCVLSNGVLSLTPNKRDTFREIHRVLRPGGRIQIADVTVPEPIPLKARETVRLWTECVAGAIPEREYLTLLQEIGFRDVEIVERVDVFAGTQIDANACTVGAVGSALRARKPRGAG